MNGNHKFKSSLLAMALLLTGFGQAAAQFPASNLNIGTINPGDEMAIIFEVTVNNSIPTTVNEVCNQGTVSGSNFADVSTNDPDTPAGGDATCTMINHADIGVVAITSPASGCELGDEEIVTIMIMNFTPLAQTGFDVTYSVAGPINTAPVTENVGALVLPGSGTLVYTFSAKADLSAPGSYVVTAATALTGDANPANNSTSTAVESFDAPVANAGAVASAICAGEQVTLGGSPAATGGSGPYTFAWSPTEGLNDPASPNPIASPVVSTTYTLTVTDANGCVGTDAVTVDVHDFLFLSGGNVDFGGNKLSEGNVHANKDINFDEGLPGTHTGNLEARVDVTIDEDNTIVGNAKAGDDIRTFENAVITGTVTSHTTVDFISMPALSFTAGGPSKTAEIDGALHLAPGSYNEVIAEARSVLYLTAGSYFIRDLDTDDKAQMVFDVSGGPIRLHITEKIDLDDWVEWVIEPSGEHGTANVTALYLGKHKIDIAPKCTILGTILAPHAEVHFSQGSRFKGSICAKEITLDKNVASLFHTSTTPLPGPPLSTDVADDKDITEVVTDFVLAQNYPNPFNPTTQIAFELPKPGRVSLLIYNTAGQVVRRLVLSDYAAGRHRVTWDALDDNGVRVASGVYLYVLRVGAPGTGSVNGTEPAGQGFVAQRKLILMK